MPIAVPPPPAEVRSITQFDDTAQSPEAMMVKRRFDEAIRQWEDRQGSFEALRDAFSHEFVPLPTVARVRVRFRAAPEETGPRKYDADELGES